MAILEKGGATYMWRLPDTFIEEATFELGLKEKRE